MTIFYSIKDSPLQAIETSRFEFQGGWSIEQALRILEPEEFFHRATSRLDIQRSFRISWCRGLEVPAMLGLGILRAKLLVQHAAWFRPPWMSNASYLRLLQIHKP